MRIINKNPKLVIVIPTRERADTLRFALETCTAQNYEPLEILVSDNASTDATREVVAATNDARVTYINTGRRLEMSSNWDFALRQVQTGYVCFLGDDDGMLRDGARLAADLIVRSECGGVSWHAGSYGWPTHPVSRYANYLTFSLRKSAVIRESATELELFRKGKKSYLDLMNIYANGFVDVKYLKQLGARYDGRVFRAIAPDLFAAIALTRAMPRYVKSYLPLSLAGASHNSNGATATAAAEKDAVLLEGEIKRYYDEMSEVKLHERLEMCRSMSLAIGDAWLRAHEVSDPGDSAGQLDIIKHTLSRMVKESSETQPALGQLIIATASKIALKNNLEWFLRPLVAAKPPFSTPLEFERRPFSGVSIGNANVEMDTSVLSINNVMDACKLAQRMLGLDSIDHVALQKMPRTTDTLLRVGRYAMRRFQGATQC